MDLVTYLTFNGDCEAAFQHYEKVLGGQILMMMRSSDMPGSVEIKESEKHLVMHARLKVGDRLLMGGDAPPERYAKPHGFCSHIMIEDPVAAERIFREIGEGGAVQMPIAETFWARRFGIVHDKFGIPWMINCENDMTAPSVTAKPFVVSRSFDVPREKLWEAFNDPDRMQKWWGPKGFKNISSKMDFKAGGTYHYGLQAPDGNVMWGRQVYRSIQPRERIEFISSFSDEHRGLARHPLAPAWPLELHTVFDFKPLGPATSALTVTWTPHQPTEAERTAFENGHESMKNGWGGTLDQLEAYLHKI